MKLLVTGGAGFIGSAFIRRVCSGDSYSVLNIDKLTYASQPDSLDAISHQANYQFQQVDIVDLTSLSKVFERFKPDAVINFAAESHVDRSIDSANAFIETNIKGVVNLLECVKELAPDAKFLQVSTDEVYGDGYSVDNPASESDYIHASSPYSASKAGAEQLVLAWGRTHDLAVMISRCTNNYGPWQFPEKLIPLVIEKALSGQKIPIYGNGRQQRDWLHVDDHVSALILMLNDFKSGSIYNIAADNLIDNISLVETLLAELSKQTGESLSGYQKLITFTDDRPGHDKLYAVSADKVKCDYRWRPIVSFADGIAETVKFYLKQRK
jgi:dTDP-glucose 4,6-dehydratase